MARIQTGIQEVDPRHALEVPRLEAYLREELEGFQGPLRVRQFMGGQSNPTYHLTGGPSRPPSRAQSEWVLRRKPPGELLSSAHAVDREYRILRALQPLGLPVPRARLYCDDPEIIGTPFYVMDKVEGRILVDQSLPDFSPEERRAHYDSQISTLAAIHEVDVSAAGLEDYGKEGNYFARQVHVWTRQYRGSDVAASPAMERLIEWLPDNIPAGERRTIVHGDYALNNMVTHPTEARVAAVLDWELSTLGDPLGDATYHLSQRHYEGSALQNLADAALQERGIPTQDEYIARYCELTGRDGIDKLDWYIAFHIFRSAGIMFGIAGRARIGTAASAQAKELGKLAYPLADSALALARRLGA